MHMAEPMKGPFLPWGSLLTMAGLAGFVVLRFNPLGAEEAALSPSRLWAAVVTTATVFLVERHLQNYFWAVLAAVLLVLHPLFHRFLEQTSGRAAGAEALVLVTFACTVFAWQLTVLPRFASVAWVGTAFMLSLGIGMAWACSAEAGLKTAVLTVAGLWLAAGLANQVKPGVEAPSSWNRIAAGLFGLLSPLGGLAVASLTVRFLQRTAEESTDCSGWWSIAVPEAWEPSWRVLSGDQLARWCWPSVWLVAPILAWSVWRSLRRGWKQWKRGQAPLAWLLSLYVVLTLTWTGLFPPDDPAATVLSLNVLTVLLLVFWLGDLIRGFFERLVLHPPEERPA
jgi:hypothetical protein